MGYPVSAGFEALLTVGHDPVFRVDIQDAAGDVLLTLDTVTGGGTTDDRTRPVRRDGTFTLAGLDLDPTDVSDLLVPVGNEVAPYRGILVDGAPELIPLGVLGISRPETTISLDGSMVTVACYDRARRIQRATLTSSYVILAGGRLDDVLTAFLQNRWAGCPPIRSSVDDTLTSRVVWTWGGDDPWTLATNLATAYGCDLHFDVDGVPVLDDLPDPKAQTPDATLGSGPFGVVISAVRALDDEGSWSGVMVTSDNTDAPVRSIAWDEDPGSPTYFDGDFGRVPFPFSSSHINSQFAADRTAQRLLPLYAGVLQQASWQQVVHAHRQAGDLLGYDDAATGFAGAYSLEAVSIPMTLADPMTAKVKERRLWLG